MNNSVYSKIATIQQEVRKLKAFQRKGNKKVDFGKTQFDYFDLDYLLEHLLPLFEKEGLMLTWETATNGQMYNTPKPMKVYNSALKQYEIQEKPLISVPIIVKLTITDIKVGQNQVIFNHCSFGTDDKDSAHAFGKASTYGRRYALYSLLNIKNGDNVEEQAIKREKEAQINNEVV